MNAKESILKEISHLHDEGRKFISAFESHENKSDFSYKYQSWYTRSLRVVEIFAPDRYVEFKSYYEVNQKREHINHNTFVIQDYLRSADPNPQHIKNSNPYEKAVENVKIQFNILASLIYLADSALANIEAELFSEIQDSELEQARQLTKINLRAAGSLAGVVIERYLQKLAKSHGIKFENENPTINSINDSLKKKDVFQIPVWRKISYLGDIRNICAHKKEVEPAKEQVGELIDGANWLIKNVF